MIEDDPAPPGPAPLGRLGDEIEIAASGPKARERGVVAAIEHLESQYAIEADRARHVVGGERDGTDAVDHGGGLRATLCPLKQKREDMMSIDLGKLLRSAAACSVALGALTATAHAQSAGSWVTKAPVPAALNEVTVAYAGGKIHVLGGSVLGFTGPYHQEYDPATDKWRARAPLPRALDHIGSAVLNGKVYAVGGFVGGGVHRDGQNTAFEYDPALDTWRILAPLKAGRGSVGVVALDGKIHALGGRTPDGTPVVTHQVY